MYISDLITVIGYLHTAGFFLNMRKHVDRIPLSYRNPNLFPSGLPWNHIPPLLYSSSLLDLRCNISKIDWSLHKQNISDYSDICMEPFFPLSRNVVHVRGFTRVQNYTDQKIIFCCGYYSNVFCVLLVKWFFTLRSNSNNDV